MLSIAAILSCWLSAPLNAQLTSGAIVGIVYDPTGAAVPNSTVTATDVATGAVRTVESDATGYYTIPSLPPDTYELRAAAAGFAVLSSQVTLALNQTLSFDFHLTVGNSTQKVEVTASAGRLGLETEDHQVGNLLGAHTLENMPANGRNLFTTLQTATNVAPHAANILDVIWLFGGTNSSLTIGGSASGTTSYLQDGVSNFNMLTKTANVQPPIESAQEVSLVQNGASARFDEPSVVNVITKSGTNQFHGRAYDYLRNDELDTVGYRKVAKPPLRYNQFGVNIGGPILRNKLFLFFDYSALRNSTSSTTYALVPTAAERQGDFSGDSYIIYDPATYNPVTHAIVPFPGNKIPTNRISSFAQQFMAYYPLPTGSVIPKDNFQKTVNTISNYDSYLARIDYNAGSRDTIYGAYETANPHSLSNNISTNPIFNSLHTQSAKNAYVQETHIFNPHLVNIAGFGYNASNIFLTTVGTGTENFAAKFGLKNLNPAPSQYEPPTVTLSTHSNLGSDITPSGALQRLYEASDELNVIHGKHYIYLGGELDKIDMNGNWTLWNNGQYTFKGQYTSNHSATKLAGGQDIADLLLGFPQTAEGGTGVTTAAFRQWNVLPYIQDNWRVTSKLTLNLGLRYDYYGSPNDANGHSNIYVVQTNTNHPGTFHQTYLDFAPRIGFAYSLRNNLVVHGGYGIYYAPFQYNQLQFMMINPPNFHLQLYTYPLDTLTPVTDTFVANPSLSAQAPYTIALDMPVPSAQQWNLSFQRSLGRSWVTTLSYLGSKSTHIAIRQNVNQAALPANPANPSPIASRRPYPYAGDVFQVSDIAYGNYNAFEAELEKRFSRGLSVLTSYVFSKSLDALNNSNQNPQYGLDVAAEYGLSDFNAPQTFKFSSVYELPVGTGKQWLGTKNWFNDKVIGGWQLSDTLMVVGGLPFNVTATDLSNTGGNHAMRANQLCDGNRPAHQSIQQWFDTACYVQPGIGQLGSERRDNILGPRTTNLDVSLFKSVPFAEGKFVQFRSDFLDALNHPLLGMPSASVSAATYGQITGVGGARIVQLSLKLIY